MLVGLCFIGRKALLHLLFKVFLWKKSALERGRKSTAPAKAGSGFRGEVIWMVVGCGLVAPQRGFGDVAVVLWGWMGD